MSKEKKESAESIEKEADEELKTNCCKLKPNYLNAIPLLKEAADLYNGSKQYEKEIKCRYKLCTCFKNTKSFWEEGHEYEKIALVKIKNLKNYEDSLIDIKNADASFLSEKEYNSAIKFLLKISKEFQIAKEIKFYIECLKIAYENIIKNYHVICFKKDEPKENVFIAIDEYVSILIKNDDFDEAENVIDNFLKKLKDEDKNNLDKIQKMNLWKLALFLVKGDFNGYETYKENCVEDSNFRAIEKIKNAFEDFNEKKFKDGMNDINYLFPINFCNKLNLVFKNKKKDEKNKKIDLKDVNIKMKEKNEDKKNNKNDDLDDLL